MYLEKEVGKGGANKNESSANVLTSLAGPKAAWWILKVFFCLLFMLVVICPTSDFDVD